MEAAYSVLPISNVDKSADRPLYEQVAADLRRLIDAGDLTAGAALPAEMDLADRYGVSRHTIRAALAELEAEDRISRSAGRGTFVKQRRAPTTFYLDRSFTRHMEETGRRAHTELLREETGTVEANAPAPLSDRIGSRCLKLARLRFGDDEPIALQHAVILMSRCPGVEAFDWADRSLYEVLARRYELVITRIEHAIGVSSADRRQALLLNVEPGAPLLRIVTSSFLEGDELIECTTSYYPADRYEYRTVHRLEGR
ncbi:MAG: GntR family transcriptional regulator [Rhodothermales bacterium]